MRLIVPLCDLMSCSNGFVLLLTVPCLDGFVSGFLFDGNCRLFIWFITLQLTLDVFQLIVALCHTLVFIQYPDVMRYSNDLYIILTCPKQIDGGRIQSFINHNKLLVIR
eukprot:410701_1